MTTPPPESGDPRGRQDQPQHQGPYQGPYPQGPSPHGPYPQGSYQQGPSSQPPQEPPRPADARRYGPAGTSPREASLPQRPLPDDLSAGWSPEDSRQHPRSPFPRPRLFATQSMLGESLRKRLRHPGEMPWLIVAFCVTLAAYTWSVWILVGTYVVGHLMSTSTDPSLQEAAESLYASTFQQILALILLLPLAVFFYRGLLYGQLRLTAVRMTPTQFPEGYRMVVEAAAAAGLRRVPDAYVMLGNGMINAFASGHGHRRFVTVYSDLFEIGGKARDPEALRFIIGHEVGHIAAGHVSYFRLLGMSFFEQVPILSKILSRAQEYTADNFGYRYCPEGARGSIAVLAAGKYLNVEVNVDEFADRAVYERGPFTWMANLAGTHPSLTWRAHALRDRSRPGRLIWRPGANPPPPPRTMVPSMAPAAEKAQTWSDPLQARRFLVDYPEREENQHWSGNEVRHKVPAEQRDRGIDDILDTHWTGPGERFRVPAAPQQPWDYPQQAQQPHPPRGPQQRPEGPTPMEGPQPPEGPAQQRPDED